jgi:hypothetical protein
MLAVLLFASKRLSSPQTWGSTAGGGLLIGKQETSRARWLLPDGNLQGWQAKRVSCSESGSISRCTSSLLWAVSFTWLRGRAGTAGEGSTSDWHAAHYLTVRTRCSGTSHLPTWALGWRDRPLHQTKYWHTRQHRATDSQPFESSAAAYVNI